jgi:hypothetical protein
MRFRQRGDDGFVWGRNAVLQHLQGQGHAVKRPVEATLSLRISTQQTLCPHARQGPCPPQRETNCCATTNYYLTNRWRHHQRKHASFAKLFRRLRVSSGHCQHPPPVHLTHLAHLDSECANVHLIKQTDPFHHGCDILETTNGQVTCPVASLKQY